MRQLEQSDGQDALRQNRADLGIAEESRFQGLGIRALNERDAALEDWLRTEGVARYEAYKRDPRGRPAEKVFARLRQYHAKRAKRSAR